MTRLFLTTTDRLGIAATATGQRAKDTAEQCPMPAPSIPIPFRANFPRLLLRPVIGLTACLVIGCVVSIAYGHLHSTANSSTRIGLGHCGTVFCVSGVTPGRTDWSKAQIIFAAANNHRLFDHQIYVPIGSDGGAALYPSADGLTVEQISIDIPSETPLTIGELVDQFGPPCFLTFPVNPNDQTLILYYPFLTVFAQIAQGRLTFDSPATYIALSAVTNLAQISVDPCRAVTVEYTPNITRPWRGFATVSHYLVGN